MINFYNLSKQKFMIVTLFLYTIVYWLFSIFTIFLLDFPIELSLIVYSVWYIITLPIAAKAYLVLYNKMHKV